MFSGEFHTMYERSKIKKQFLNNISEHSEPSIVSFLHPRVAYFLDPIEALTTSKGSRIKFFNNTFIISRSEAEEKYKIRVSFVRPGKFLKFATYHYNIIQYDCQGDNHIGKY